MSTGLFGIGITGINAAQMGMMTTGHNIANVNTAGYNRQRISQSSNVPIGTGAGFLGQGTRVDTVSRIYNSVITNQINQSQANASELSKYYDQIKQIDNMLADHDPNDARDQQRHDSLDPITPVRRRLCAARRRARWVLNLSYD